MPLSCMNTFAQDWVIKCKVTKKNMRNWSNARGNGTMLNVDLIDKTGTQIQGTFFNDAAVSNNDKIVEGKVYTFSGG